MSNVLAGKIHQAERRNLMKRILALIILVSAIAACSRNSTGRLLENSEKISITPTPLSIQNIQINPASVLPPYGIRVRADIAAMKLRVSSTKEDTTARLETIQKAVEQFSELAANDDSVELQYISVSRVSSGSDRGTAEPYFGERYDSSSAVLKLTTNLAEHNDNLLESLIAFNTFLSNLNLSETVTIETLSIEAEISDPEIYREQLIAKVYQELEAVQEEYGQSVKFEITGLYGRLQTIPLTDTEYYLYLEPAIAVHEF